MHSVIRIGTRGSQLALWQARTVATALEGLGVAAELVIIRTSGDRLQEAPLSEAGGKRLFVKEIEDALLREDIDLAVHSAKDMPAVLPDGLEVAATLPREDPRDVIVLPHGARGRDAAAVLAQLGAAPRIGTSSIRRVAQLAALVPQASFAPIRGNVDTRLRKLDDGEYDALVLAAAGLLRLGFAERISAAVAPDDCIPAPGQGVVAIEIRSSDHATHTVLQRLHDQAAATALLAERTVVAALGGGCQLPIGALAVQRGPDLELHAIVCSADGTRAVRTRESGPSTDPAGLGTRVARRLIDQGAAAILDEVRADTRPS